jgi:hypothetical protein
VEELGKVPKEALDAAGTRIVVIGCGDWPVIKTYRGWFLKFSYSFLLYDAEDTWKKKIEYAEDAHNYPYEIYAEPTRELHKILGLGSSIMIPSGPKKSYVPNVFTSTLGSLKVISPHFSFLQHFVNLDVLVVILSLLC